ncbi:MAG: hypothetical protein IPH52_03740 [Leptospiraceae bacterium]|nr:hypothetical protein [Leptospiraceae bacterium]MBK7054155.1 hypothetical protein [Leptospiraceae bacterium]
MKIEINFIKDIAISFRGELERYGYKNIPDDNDGIVNAYFKVLHRIISFAPRSIEKSDAFLCPPELIHGLEILEYKITKGENINSYQSKKLMDTQENDPLLNDWGIHHLHLGVENKANGFIERSGSLLYAFFTEDTAYFINVLGHGEWTNKSLLEILDRNWSELTVPWEMNIINIEEFDSESMGKMRKVGGTFFTKINGKVFAPPGGGYTTARTSMIAGIDSDHFLMRLEDYEKGIKDNLGELEKIIKRNLNAKINKLDLKPEIKNGILFAKDKNYNLSFELGAI